MELLERTPQDIKLTRNFKPCAPQIFRWFVVVAYLSVLVAGVALLGVNFHEKHVNSTAGMARKKLDELNERINSIRSQGVELQAIHQNYEQQQTWLKGNYSLGPVLAMMYATLPENARLMELTLAQDSGTNFKLSMKLFPQSSGPNANLEDWASKLEEKGVVLDGRQQAVGEGGHGEFSATFAIPPQYVPGGVAPVMMKGPQQ